VDNDGRIPLILAGQEGHLEVVQQLVEGHSPLDHKAHDGKNAFRCAAFEGHKDVVSYLLTQDTVLNYKDVDGRSTLYVLALENRLAMAGFLLENGADVESCDLEGRTPLHVAAWQGHTDMVDMLLNFQANVNAVDNDNRTSLQSAAWQGHVDIVKVLLQNGADVNHTCNQGATALCIAAQEGHDVVVKVLLQYQANPNHADQFGRTAMRVALKGGHSKCVTILEEFGAVSSSNGANKCGGSASGSGDSKQSGSSAFTHVSALANGHVGSPVESPESTADKRKSFMSNQSSKSSSNLTSNSSLDRKDLSRREGSISIQNQPFTMDIALSFTQQIQQCTHNSKGKGNRPVSRVLSPVSEPQSPVHTPAGGSPVSEIQTSLAMLRMSPENITQFTTTPNPTAKHVTPKREPLPSSIHFIMNPNAEFLSAQDEPDDDPVWQLNPQLRSHVMGGAKANVAKLELKRKGSLPESGSPKMGQRALGHVGMKSPDTRKKQNGVCPNPTVISNPTVNNPTYGIVGNINGYVNQLANLADDNLSALGGTPAITPPHRTKAQRPTGLPIKKETPL
jgi:ankyrin repeat protein